MKNLLNEKSFWQTVKEQFDYNFDFLCLCSKTFNEQWEIPSIKNEIKSLLQQFCKDNDVKGIYTLPNSDVLFGLNDNSQSSLRTSIRLEFLDWNIKRLEVV